jgi:hypothetical protein
VICDRLGKYEKGRKYTELAGKIHPQGQDYLNNAYYFKNKVAIPAVNVLSPLESTAFLSHSSSSLLRFGDSEFDIMMGRGSHAQSFSSELQTKLTELFTKPASQFLLSIPGVYAAPSRLPPGLALNWWKGYMDRNQKATEFISPGRMYLESFLSSPTVHFPKMDRTLLATIFTTLRDVWNGKTIVVVADEDFTKYNSTLFDNAKVKGVVYTPTVDVYSKYNEILAEVVKIKAQIVVMLAIGPAGKVLGQELVSQGYRVLDLGNAARDYAYLQGQYAGYPNTFTRD